MQNRLNKLQLFDFENNKIRVLKINDEPLENIPNRGLTAVNESGMKSNI